MTGRLVYLIASDLEIVLEAEMTLAEQLHARKYPINDGLRWVTASRYARLINR